MDTKLLIIEAKARFKHSESKIYLIEKYTNRLTFASQGGMWTITPELIGFLKTSTDTVILMDSYRNPVKVNSQQLHKEAEQLYTEVMTEWYEEFTKLQSLR